MTTFVDASQGRWFDGPYPWPGGQLAPPQGVIPPSDPSNRIEYWVVPTGTSVTHTESWWYELTRDGTDYVSTTYQPFPYGVDPTVNGYDDVAIPVRAGDFYRSVMYWNGDQPSTPPIFPALPAVLTPTPTPPGRWSLADGPDVLIFERSPSKMDSFDPPKQTDTFPVSPVDGRSRSSRRAQAPYERTFSGRIYTQSFYDDLKRFYDIDRTLTLITHKGEAWRVKIINFEPTSMRTTSQSTWRFEYTMRVLVYGRRP